MGIHHIKLYIYIGSLTGLSFIMDSMAWNSVGMNGNIFPIESKTGILYFIHTHMIQRLTHCSHSQCAHTSHYLFHENLMFLLHYYKLNNTGKSSPLQRIRKQCISGSLEGNRFPMKLVTRNLLFIVGNI